jgi:hypothetical protein
VSTTGSIRMAIARGRHGALGVLWRILGRMGVFIASVIVRARDRSVALYLRGSTAQGDDLPGMSDIDMVALVPDDGVERTRRAWKTARRFVAVHRLVSVGVWRAADLRNASRATALTYRLSTDEQVPSSATAPALVRPDLYGAGIGWRLVSGRDVRPRAVTWDETERGIVAWGELQHWWRFIYKTALRERVMDHLNYPWLKVVAEHARVLLWLDHSIVVRSRPDVLATAVRIWPDDEIVRWAHTNWDTGSSPASVDVPEVLAWALSKVRTAADRLDDGSSDTGATTVELRGSLRPTLPAKAEGDEVLPLADWHGRALVRPFEEGLVPAAGDPTDLDFLAHCVRDGDRVRHRAVRHDGLLLLPAAEYGRSLYRAIQCPVSDPVSFALLNGESRAIFPAGPGWSSPDCARRAVEEHALWLRSSAGPSLRTLGRLLNAVRAASFASSLESASPALPLSRIAAAENPPEGVSSVKDAVAAYAVSLRVGTAVPHDLIDKLRGELLRLPAFAELRGRVSPQV